MRAVACACIVFGCLAAACGDDDGSSRADDDAGQRGGSPFDPRSCPPMNAAVPAGCTRAEIDEYMGCLSDACEPVLERCYGSDYRSGRFSGACKERLECATARCSCDDLDCVAACPGADACTECVLYDRCGLACPQPRCALEASFGDAGIDFARSCAEVLACCATLDAGAREQCRTAVDMIKSVAGASADPACSPLLATFGASSSDPACQ